MVLWVCSMPIVANTALGALEKRYPAVALNQVPESQCLVLLGGSLEPVRPPRVDVNLLEAADRISKTASLYHAGKAKLIIISGGNQPRLRQLKTEAAEARSLLIAWGVPAEAIILDETSENTHGNAFNSAILLRESRCKKPLLVTSAAHMQRSVASFAKLGVDVFPVSTDVRAVRVFRLSIFNFLPDIRALEMTTSAMREWYGQKVYKIRGWN